MPKIYTLATFEVRAGAEEEFESAQRALADTAMAAGGTNGALLRRMDNPQCYISFGTWASVEDAGAWRSSEAFAEIFGRIGALCDDIVAGPCEVVYES